MKCAILTALLLLAGAAPATRPTSAPTGERLVVQVRHVDYAQQLGDRPIVLEDGDVTLPNDFTERSSLQVTTSLGQPFEAVAVLNGTTYRLAGSLKRVTGDAQHISVEIDYCESSGDVARSVSQVKSRIVARVGKPMPMGGMTSGRTGSVMIVVVKRA